MKARDRLPIKNCPSPGSSKEAINTKERLIVWVRVFPKVVMFDLCERDLWLDELLPRRGFAYHFGWAKTYRFASISIATQYPVGALSLLT